MENRKIPLVLTIDDEKIIRESFRELLEDNGYDVIEAENGNQGLEKFVEYRPDLILVDMIMPEMGGLELLENVTRFSLDTPIIIISGVGDLTDAVKALKLGAWDYILKPVNDLAMLLHTIERALERRRLILQNREYHERLEDKVAEQTITLEQTHLELQESEKQYRTIVETAREGIWILDKQKNISFLTLRSANMFGYSVDEMLEKNIAVFSDPEFHLLFDKKLDELLEGAGSQFDMKFKRKDGSLLWGIVSANPIFSSNEKIESIFLMIMDITGRKKAEEELAHHKTHLEDLVRERTEALETAHKELVEKAHKAGMADIASDIVHNVGNVLNSVKTSVQIIDDVLKHSTVFSYQKANELLKENIDNNSLESFISNDERGKALMHYFVKLEESLFQEHQEMKGLTDGLKNMVDAITDIVSAQYSYANVDWLVEEVNLDKIVLDALSVIQHQLDENKVQIITDFEKIRSIPIQKIKLLHSLINIVKNACEAMLKMPEKQRILKISISYDSDKADGAIITLRDYGIGIPTENLERIFSYGFTSKKGRYGLGLHSCANYMTEMGGKIWAENNPESPGVSFFLRFRIPSN
jgi:PAS domain S-box-containing protein